MKDAHGYQLTGCNSEAQALLDQALAQFRCLHAESLATTEATLQASPELVMGHVLHAWLYLLGTEAAALPVARTSYEHALELPHNDREARHLQALRQLLDGRWRRRTVRPRRCSASTICCWVPVATGSNCCTAPTWRRLSCR